MNENSRFIIGFSGYAGAGKSTAAKMFLTYMAAEFSRPDVVLRIVDNWELHKVSVGIFSEATIMSFADPLRDICETLTGIPAEEWKTPEIKNNLLPAPYGTFTGRQFLEHLGTEVLRNNLNVDCHIHACNIRDTEKDVIYDDVRMPNEAEYIKSNGGVIINIGSRGKSRPHESGKGLDKKYIDYKVDNSGDLLYLAEQIKELSNKHIG